MRKQEVNAPNIVLHDISSQSHGERRRSRWGTAQSRATRHFHAQTHGVRRRRDPERAMSFHTTFSGFVDPRCTTFPREFYKYEAISEANHRFFIVLIFLRFSFRRSSQRSRRKLHFNFNCNHNRILFDFIRSIQFRLTCIFLLQLKFDF